MRCIKNVTIYWSIMKGGEEFVIYSFFILIGLLNTELFLSLVDDLRLQAKWICCKKLKIFSKKNPGYNSVYLGYGCISVARMVRQISIVSSSLIIVWSHLKLRSIMNCVTVWAGNVTGWHVSLTHVYSCLIERRHRSRPKKKLSVTSNIWLLLFFIHWPCHTMAKHTHLTL